MIEVMEWAGALYAVVCCLIGSYLMLAAAWSRLERWWRTGMKRHIRVMRDAKPQADSRNSIVYFNQHVASRTRTRNV